jgi:hypothetical protein
MNGKQYAKTTAGLRDLLFDTALGVRSHEIDVNEAKAIATLAHQIVSTLDIELKAQLQASDLQLGSEDAKIIAPPQLQLTDESPKGD